MVGCVRLYDDKPARSPDGMIYHSQVGAGAGGDGALAQTLELIPGGDDVEVTEANRQEYMRAFVSTRLA